MKATGIKFIVEHKNEMISTWHDNFDMTVEEIINKVKHDKSWIGGKFLEIYIEFTDNRTYYKVYLDIKNQKYNQLLGS
jgi:coproporphyrinogen III oxidase